MELKSGFGEIKESKAKNCKHFLKVAPLTCRGRETTGVGTLLVSVAVVDCE